MEQHLEERVDEGRASVYEHVYDEEHADGHVPVTREVAELSIKNSREVGVGLDADEDEDDDVVEEDDD